MATELLATQDNPVLLHGDLHPDNILLNGTDSWLAIDPTSIIGERAHEVSTFVRNPLPELLASANAAEIIRQRLNLFSAELSIDKERLRSWSYVKSILSACWALEDHDEQHAKNAVVLAAIIHSL